MERNRDKQNGTTITKYFTNDDVILSCEQSSSTVLVLKQPCFLLKIPSPCHKPCHITRMEKNTWNKQEAQNFWQKFLHNVIIGSEYASEQQIQ